MSITFVAATALEYDALRRALPTARVVRCGIALANLGESLGDTVVSCGLAGGLRPGVPTGTVLVPRLVRRPDGTTLLLDAELVEALTHAATSLGFAPLDDPLLTAETIVSGAQRKHWADQGYAGVDMETGRIVAERIAAVRVVLDTPEKELSPQWVHPARALLDPRNWPQAAWLAREAPRAAELAARVAACAQGIGERVRITGQ